MKKNPGMTWHDIFATVILLFQIILLVLNAMSFLTSAYSDESWMPLYSSYSGLKAVNIAFFILYCFLVWFAIKVRKNLIYLADGGAQQFYKFAMILVLAPFLYGVIMGITFDDGTVLVPFLLRAVIGTLLYGCTALYYKKRKYLFVNQPIVKEGGKKGYLMAPDDIIHNWENYYNNCSESLADTKVIEYTEKEEEKKSNETGHNSQSASYAITDQNSSEIKQQFCRYCGREIPGDSIFCGYCGNKIKEENSGIHSASQSAQRVLPIQEPTREKEMSSDRMSRKQLKCKKCGGAIHPDTMLCTQCGVRYLGFGSLSFKKVAGWIIALMMIGLCGYLGYQYYVEEIADNYSTDDYNYEEVDVPEEEYTMDSRYTTVGDKVSIKIISSEPIQAFYNYEDSLYSYYLCRCQLTSKKYALVYIDRETYKEYFDDTIQENVHKTFEAEVKVLDSSLPVTGTVIYADDIYEELSEDIGQDTVIEMNDLDVQEMKEEIDNLLKNT